MKKLAGSEPTDAQVSSELTTTTVIDGLTIVTETYQSSPSTLHGFNVTLE